MSKPISLKKALEICALRDQQTKNGRQVWTLRDLAKQYDRTPEGISYIIDKHWAEYQRAKKDGRIIKI